jgi:hypothetical protein
MPRFVFQDYGPGSAGIVQPVIPRTHEAAWLSQYDPHVIYSKLQPLTCRVLQFTATTSGTKSFVRGHLKTSTAQYSTERLKTVFTSPRPFGRISEISKSEQLLNLTFLFNCYPICLNCFQQQFLYILCIFTGNYQS